MSIRQPDSTMSFTVIIPARMKSTRLPEKPLKDICGKPMIVRVAEAARATGASRIAVATDHADILKACLDAGIEAVMTSEDCATGTDRLAEAAERLGLGPDEIVVNVQGDEPLMPAEAVNRTAELLAERPECAIATAAHTLTSVEDFFNPNVVKVELDGRGNALTFSRAPIPWPRDAFREDRTKLPEGFRPLHHLGLYAYRVGFLRRFPTLPPAPIERTESLEQLRALWNGERIAVLVLDKALPAGVDTEEDLERVRAIFAARN